MFEIRLHGMRLLFTGYEGVLNPNQFSENRAGLSPFRADSKGPRQWPRDSSRCGPVSGPGHGLGPTVSSSMAPAPAGDLRSGPVTRSEDRATTGKPEIGLRHGYDPWCS